ncbi:MAG: efflux RND transporter periplasmic adaptor subunit, partial [Rhodospirillaceae bacterium]|nr:efflux RND transporter periplasmic adaptor subunit [Rhodospirillaceae bacterium]
AASKLGKEGFRSKINTAGAKADLEAAMAAVASAKSNFDNVTIRAPFSGIVDSIPVEVGDMVSKGRVAAKIIDISHLKISAEVAERDAGNIAVGGASKINLMDGRTFNGVVSYVSRSSNISTRTYAVEVSVDVPDMSVGEGATAELILPMETISAHMVSPAILTLNDDGQLGIKTVSKDNIVMFYPVEMVSDTRSGIWISGLNDIENFIVVGQEFVQVGQEVESVPADFMNEKYNGKKVEGM